MLPKLLQTAADRNRGVNSRGLLLLGFCLGTAALAGTVAGQPVDGGRPKIGVALAGGGAKGCAHIGVLQIFEEMGIPVDYVAGTSMGSVIGGLYAVGYSADALDELVRSIDWATAMRDRPSRADLSFRRKQESLRYPFDLELGFKDGKLRWPRGLSPGQNLFLLLRNYTLPVAGVDDFDQLPIPFRAIAADLNTGERVVLRRGDLPRAIRASMAIPGYFTPVELDGRTLVDGGVVDNLPIDEVRAMGADIVIAITLGQTLEEGNTETMMQVLGQTRAFLTKRQVDPQLERADLVLRPDVAGFSILNFEAAADIIAAGIAAAEASADELRAYAFVNPYRGQDRQPIPSSVTTEYVRLEGQTRVDPRIVDAKVDVAVGEELDFPALGDAITRLYGLGDFETIEYNVERDGDGRPGLVLKLRDKPWGPNYLRFGIDLQTDLDGDLSFSFLGSYTATRLNARGAEWRTDLALGTERRLLSEIYQPLDFRGEWFAAGRMELSLDRLRVFDQGRQIAELDIQRREAHLDVGYQFDEFGEIRLGLESGRANASIASGGLGRELDAVDFGAIVLEATGDRLDRSVLPRQGTFAKLRVLRAEPDLGSEKAYTKISFDSARFQSRGRHTLFFGLDGGWSPGGDLPFYDEFRVGGLLSFSGFREDELRGQDFVVLRAGYARQVSSGGALARRMVLGGWLEAGNAWTTAEDPGFDDLIYTLTFGLGADTLIGPVYLAYGYADEGSDRLYIGIGRSF